MPHLTVGSNHEYRERALLAALEIISVVITLTIGGSIVWSTLRVGISPMPSSGKARDAIINLTANTGTGAIYDLGSGWGGLVIKLAQKYPNRNIVGYEVSFFPWMVSICAKKTLGIDNLEIHRKNFLAADLSEAEVLICFLHTDGMRSVARKLAAENGTNRFLISNYFALPSFQPETSLQINDFYRSWIYRYRLSE
ncbi:MAG: class I SAM-dependent methyltransferase [Saccharospirillum sp.]